MANKTYEQWKCSPKDMVFTDNGANAGLSQAGPVTFKKVSKVKDTSITPDEALALNSGANVHSNLDCDLYLLPGAETEFLISEIQY
ncbi:MAG: hypothetical protein JWR61_5654 [Ferruginibacter sp.]|uniref:hypothetical protein n=1 Tax=Ferruginibacter sp. TaxID=1940288 RepID=UPI002659D6E0|nr:hypothetical protein [Ferruginibacter sp.]MDB5280699.1 hypothetical protein [Ferruginibacter sp.]